MTLKDISLKPEYISLRDDVVQEFYIPVMKECIRFDRISCYFSMQALSTYCEGIYYLGKRNKGRYRLLISNDVSEETFRAIRDGYEKNRYVDELTRNRMVENLTLHDRINLSNLSYLMACGIVEIKFGYCPNGLFHSKSGYVEDDFGNRLCFVGSNNETKQSIESNYEKFDVTTSWLSSEFDRSRIEDSRQEFESLWNDQSPYAAVFDPPESFIEYLEKMNKGRLFKDELEYSENCFILDFGNERATLTVPKNENPDSVKFRTRVMSLVDRTDEMRILFKRNLRRRELRNIQSRMEQYCRKKQYRIVVTDSFISAASVNSTIESKAILGASIKQRNSVHKDEYNLFKSIIDQHTVRKLRDEQIWDSFLLYRLSKGANFSVPGSGKTATIMGVFAYMRSMGEADKIVVIGPLSSFDSWITEFEAEFHGLINLKAFRSDGDHPDLEYDFRFSSGGSNLILFNYESFDHNIKLLNLLADRIDSKTLLVFDEVHRIKKINGERANRMLVLAGKSEHSVVMTGTPIPNSYADAYNFLHILFDEDDYDTYFELTPSQLSNMDREQMKSFNHKLYPFFCRTTKEKLNVPPANQDSIITVSAGDQYNKLLMMLKKQVRNPLTMIVRILQLESDPAMLGMSLNTDECSGFFDDGSRIDGGALDIETVNGPSSKTKACVKLVRDLVQSGKPVIVWCIFRRSMDNLESILSSNGIPVCQINGSTEDRASIIEGFRNGECQVLITNPQTLAEAVSLHDVCHDAVYFEYNYNLVHLLQSKDRINRLGLPEGQYTQYYYLESEFLNDNRPVSLDRAIHDRLNEKERIMLEAIDNDEFEQFPRTLEEVEEILLDIDMMPDVV